jgi:hypothetical protein
MVEGTDEMTEKIDEETKLVYSYEDGGYFFMKRRWDVTATVYKTREKAIAAYMKKQEEIEADRKELGAR